MEHLTKCTVEKMTFGTFENMCFVLHMTSSHDYKLINEFYFTCSKLTLVLFKV